MQKLGAAVITLALLGGSAGAFVWTQERKLDDPLVRSPKIENYFSPLSDSESKSTATLAFTLSRADSLDAAVVDGNDHPVRTLATGVERRKGRVSFEWDGRGEDGAIVSDGQYRLRLRLDRADREGIVPNPTTVDTRRPRVEIARASPLVIEPEKGERVVVRFRSSERSRPYLLVDGRRAARRKVGDAGRRAFAWRATVAGRPVPAGVYRLQLQVRDRAGNLSAATPAIRVRVVR